MIRRERLCGAFIMFGAIILTFIITALTMLVLFLFGDKQNQETQNKHILKENDGLRREISELRKCDQRRRERSAYDRGLYDGRTTDTYYRQCLKKFANRDQNDVIMNGEREERQ